MAGCFRMRILVVFVDMFQQLWYTHLAN